MTLAEIPVAMLRAELRRRKQEKHTRKVQSIVPTVDAIASTFGIPRSVIMGRRRNEPIVFARFAVWFLLHEKAHSNCAIARAFNRDPSGILHGLKQARTWCEVYPDYAGKIARATLLLQPAPVSSAA